MTGSQSITLSLRNEAATRLLAERLAERLRPGDMVALTGPLGAGKSTLARALIRKLTGPTEDVPSPTFTLVQTYPTSGFEIWHFDLYRISDPVEVLELGWDEACEQVALVEWPDRAAAMLPPQTLGLSLEAPDGAPQERIARLTGADTYWNGRLDGLLDDGSTDDNTTHDNSTTG